MAGPWELAKSPTYHEWYEKRDDTEKGAIAAALLKLEEEGPALRRPLVGPITQSRHSQMKELIVPRNDIRILFAFDPLSSGILILAGSKTDNWKGWYDENVPQADAFFDQHLAKVQAFKERQEAEKKAAEKTARKGAERRKRR